MTVKELKSKLAKCPDEWEVMIEDAEGCTDELHHVSYGAYVVYLCSL